MSTTITRDEWLKALGEDAPPPCDPTAVTVMELAAMLGVGRMAAYRHVLKLIDQGKAAPTWKRATGPTGITRRVSAYKLVKQGKKK